MKNRAGTDVVLIVLAGLAAFAATGLAQGKPGKVEIKDDFIVVHPGTKLSRADAQALNDVLKKYDKSLYKIQIYKNGKVTKTLGTLNDMYIDQKAVADLAQAKASGQSERAIQLIAPPAKMAPVNPQTGGPAPGVSVNPQTGSPAPAGPQMPSSPVPSGPQAPTSPVPSGPQAPTSPVPSGPQAPTSPVPSGPQAPTSPVPSGPQTPGSPVPSGPQKSSPTPVNPQRSAATNKQAAEFMERLKPILEKYSQ
jgi:hypothetical protein